MGGVLPLDQGLPKTTTCKHLGDSQEDGNHSQQTKLFRKEEPGQKDPNDKTHAL